MDPAETAEINIQNIPSSRNYISDVSDTKPSQVLPFSQDSLSCDDLDTTVKPETHSSCDTSVVLTVRIDAVESPLEWSARMKRYQEEEIQYLGLDVIKPRLSKSPQPLVAQKSRPSHSEHRPARLIPSRVDTAVLSKQRFEAWLDTLHPRASPAISASQPSTVANSDTSLENDWNINQYPPVEDQSPCRILNPDSPLDPSVCNVCGRSLWIELNSHDRGVQTDVL